MPDCRNHRHVSPHHPWTHPSSCCSPHFLFVNVQRPADGTEILRVVIFHLASETEHSAVIETVGHRLNIRLPVLTKPDEIRNVPVDRTVQFGLHERLDAGDRVPINHHDIFQARGRVGSCQMVKAVSKGSVTPVYGSYPR